MPLSGRGSSRTPRLRLPWRARHLARRHDGPLSGDEFGIAWIEAVDDQSFTWAMPLRDDTTADDIRIESIQVVDSSGLDVLGILVSFAARLDG